MPAINLRELKYILDSIDEADLKDIPLVIETSVTNVHVEAVLKNVSEDKDKEELVLVIQ